MTRRIIPQTNSNCLYIVIAFLVLLPFLYLITSGGTWGIIIALSLIITLVVFFIVYGKKQAKKRAIFEDQRRQLAEKRKEILFLLQNEFTKRANKETKMLTEKAEIEHQKYKNKIERLYVDLIKNEEIKNVLENFLPQIPTLIFSDPYTYILFEFIIYKDNVLGRKILWSSDTDLLEGEKLFTAAQYPINPNYQTVNALISFVNNTFSNMVKLLKGMVVYVNEMDYTFVVLRLIQINASTFVRNTLELMSGIEFGEIEAMTLDECLFTYYSKYNIFYKDVFLDPGISLFTYFMIFHHKFGEIENIDYFNYLQRRKELLRLLNERKSDFDYKIFESNMKKKANKIEVGKSIYDVDLMSGDDFEIFVAKIFTKLGYSTKVTQHSRDFGVDVIAEKDEIKIAIQAKCYANPVSISAIQEVTAGMKYYKCQRGVIVTNRTFTKAAIELASINSIQLWDRKILSEKISEIF